MPQGLTLSEYQAVLFDIDGTLIDSLEMIVRGLGDTYERFAGRRPDREDLLGQIGRPIAAQVGDYFDSEPTPSLVSEMSAYAIERFEHHEEHERLFPAAIEVLRLCHRQGLRTALVTSKSDVELCGFMKRFEGADAVDATVCATDVQQPKPNPESALRACEILGVDPQRAVMIGDSVYDLRCAKEAGLKAIAVAYGAGRREVLVAERPDLLFDTPEELLAWAENAFLTYHAPQEVS